MVIVNEMSLPCVNNGVEGGVEVSEPEEEAEDMVIDAVVTERTDHGHHKEREPTHYKGSCYDSKCFCCFLFSFLLQGYMSFCLFFLWKGVKVKV